MGACIQNSVRVTFTKLVLDWLRPRIPNWYICDDVDGPSPVDTRTVFDPTDWQNEKIPGTLPHPGYGVIVDEDQKYVLFSYPPANAYEDSIMMYDIRRLYAYSPTFFEDIASSIAIIDRRMRGQCTCGYTIPGKQYRTG